MKKIFRLHLLVFLMGIIFPLTPTTGYGQAQDFQKRIQKMHTNIQEYALYGGDMDLVAPKVAILDRLIKSGDLRKIEVALKKIEKLLVIPNSPCITVSVDLEYRCPAQDININHDILLSQWKSLYTAKIDGSGEKALVVTAPARWSIHQSSITPDHKHLLLSMTKHTCEMDWRESRGRRCSWGRTVLWLAIRDQNKQEWLLKNLAPIYGYNADIHGWTVWQSNRHALFNGVIRPEGEPVLGNKQEDNNAQAYQIRLGPNGRIRVDLWGKDKMYRSDCLTGRLFTNHRHNAESCVDGSTVIFARRCYSDKLTKENFAWWNTKQTNGNGGKCDARLPKLHVPVLRVYAVETNASCQPKDTFSIDQAIRMPWHKGLFRHISKNVPEWGDMQPAIRDDGRIAAFHTVRGYEDSDPLDNCGSFKQDGRGESKVYYCEFNEGRKCTKTKLLTTSLAPHIDQGMPMFVGKAILIIEGSPKGVPVVVKMENGKRTELFKGIGGYPLK